MKNPPNASFLESEGLGCSTEPYVVSAILKQQITTLPGDFLGQLQLGVRPIGQRAGNLQPVLETFGSRLDRAQSEPRSTTYGVLGVASITTWRLSPHVEAGYPFAANRVPLTWVSKARSKRNQNV